jgi:hypothetical protein
MVPLGQESGFRESGIRTTKAGAHKGITKMIDDVNVK